MDLYHLVNDRASRIFGFYREPIVVAFVVAVTSISLYSSSSSTVVTVDDCPGYKATNVRHTASSITADLELGGPACNIYGTDIERLSLSVDYEDVARIHLKITDAANARYEVPNEVLQRPPNHNVSSSQADIQFNLIESPFSFSITRRSTGETLFDTEGNPLVFEPQYWRLQTNLPANANIYGLGEHTETFRLPTSNLIRTLWSRDAGGIPTGKNLYGNHPIYFDHRDTGTHGVFLLNSNGMDIKINDTFGTGTTLEYNVIGGLIDMYFLAGSEISPVEVAKQYAQIVGTPAEVPYWSFGFHQCRFGYLDFVEVANVITNYSAANIPLETMWTDSDYMEDAKIFTTDPKYFPHDKLREIVKFLHDHDQHYIMMVDPGVAYAPNKGYGTLDRGLADNIYLKKNGKLHFGVVWPGVVVFPDWFHPNITSFWTGEFERFFNPETGIDIDGVWIDMNEPGHSCSYPCTDPFQQAIDQGLPHKRYTPPPDRNTPIFPNASHTKRHELTDDTLNFPPYSIHDAAGMLSQGTVHVDVVHHNGLLEYDTHNLYGTMMSLVTRNAMLNRRPGLRPLVITRSTFAGAGRYVQKWLGDNLSTWRDYRLSIAGMLGMASVYQIPMVGSDVCGFGLDMTDELLCARWAMLGAFYPFYRNHNQDYRTNQEFYLWPIVAQAARNGIDARYRLLDYLYTAFHQANIDGTPVLHPLWFKYPLDRKTWAIDLQFFYGNSILVSPVTDDHSTSVDIYLPDDIFYDFHTLSPVRGLGKTVTLTDIGFDQIPLHIAGGTVLPLRSKSAMTTTLLRSQPFNFIVAPDLNSRASGSLYIDDGVSITQKPDSTTSLSMTFSNDVLEISGTFGFKPAIHLAQITFLNVDKKPKGGVTINGKAVSGDRLVFSAVNRTLIVGVDEGLTESMKVVLHN